MVELQDLYSLQAQLSGYLPEDDKEGHEVQAEEQKMEDMEVEILGIF